MKILILTNYPVSIPLVKALHGMKDVDLSVGILSEWDLMLSYLSTDDHSLRDCFYKLSEENWEQDLAEHLRDNSIDALWTISFPFKIPDESLDYPKFGSMNFHLGQLPQYRGPEPIFWQIRNGETHGALSVHKMEAQFDTGHLWNDYTFELNQNDCYGSYLQKLESCIENAGFDLYNELNQKGTLSLTPQNNQDAHYYKRPKKSDLQVDWNDNANSICNLIRACNPHLGGALSYCGNTAIQIFSANAGESNSEFPTGTIERIDHRGIAVNCRDNNCIWIRVINCHEGIFPAEIWAQNKGINVGDRMG